MVELLIKKWRGKGREGREGEVFFSASQPSSQLPVGRRSGHSPGMWESQFQLAQQCACEGEFRAHRLFAFRRGLAPISPAALRHSPAYLLFLPLCKKMSMYVPPLKKQRKTKPILKRRPWPCNTHVWAILPCDFSCRAGAGDSSLPCCWVWEMGANSIRKARPGAGPPGFASLISLVLSLQSLGMSAGRTGPFVTVL